MRLFRFAGLLLVVVLGTSMISCSDANSDAVGTACHVIVQDCHVGRSMGDCIDGIVSLPPDCIDCIAQSGCDTYEACQAASPGCRLPADLMKKP
jgi:hypothetical protein